MASRDAVRDWPRGMPIETAAEYTGVSVSMLTRLEAKGVLTATWLTPGRKVFLREDLDDWLDRQRGLAKPQPAAPDLGAYVKAMQDRGKRGPPLRRN